MNGEGRETGTYKKTQKKSRISPHQDIEQQELERAQSELLIPQEKKWGREGRRYQAFGKVKKLIKRNKDEGKRIL